MVKFAHSTCLLPFELLSTLCLVIRIRLPTFSVEVVHVAAAKILEHVFVESPVILIILLFFTIQISFLFYIVESSRGPFLAREEDFVLR